MKVSYKVLKKYIPNIKSPEEIAEDLIMHTAEVEEIHESGGHLENVFIGEIQECHKHPDADKLNICQVLILGETRQIICGAPNVRPHLRVAVALPGAELAPDFVIQKSKIRGETSNGMLCSEDELRLCEERQDGIFELPDDAPLNMCMREYLGFDDTILEVDNKAINHRPDLFSHIGIAREVAAISGNTLDYTYSQEDFTGYQEAGVRVDIPDVVKRYLGVYVSGVQNSKSPEHIKELIASHEIDSKGILVDITNYCLYLYGQPTHCFDADKLTGNIGVRYAADGESFDALNGKSYTLTPEDIVIVDDTGIIALGGVIGGADTAVSDDTTNIAIESAWFDQAVIRATGKRLGLRTDALNVFEKDLTTNMQKRGIALILSELRKLFQKLEITQVSDVYPKPSTAIEIPYEPERINSLIGANYGEKEMLDLLSRLGILEEKGTLVVPFWRKDITHIADIAEEVARLDGYSKIAVTVPRINLGAISQSPSYKAKRDTRSFLTSAGFYEMYTYSFVDEVLMQKAGDTTQHLVGLKNALSEELTHMRGSLVPNLMQALEDNAHEFKNMKLFEFEKVFHKTGDTTVSENYELAGVMTFNADSGYYDVQSIVSDICQKLGILKYSFEQNDTLPSYSHSGRTAALVIRGKQVGYLGEVSPQIVKNFDLKGSIGFFSINMELVLESLYGLIAAKEVSSFQENNFDINFVVDKSVQGKSLVTAIQKTDPLIQKVELFDIYESEEKLPGQRSLSFTVYTQSMTETLDDSYKNELIKNIVSRVKKVGGKLR